MGKLTAVEVSSIGKSGRYGDGDGLYLEVARGGSKSWVLRYMRDGVSREMGLGSVKTFSLKEARLRARQFRQQIADGIDPIEARRGQRQKRRSEAAKQVSFRTAAERYIAAHRAGWRNAKHAAQWTTTLETYAFPLIGDLSVADIDTAVVIKVLEPIWTVKVETAARLRGRVESVLDWAAVRGHRQGENPARWRGHLDKLLPAKTKVTRVEHHEAMPFAALPGFMERLRGTETIAARALEFTVLTAARTGKSIGARWSEFDFAAKVWTVPGERTKSGRPHRVPLSDRASEILAVMPREDGNEHVFIGARQGRSISSTAMLELLREDFDDFTIHGFRSTFRDWAGERTNFAREVVEAALAHVNADKVEAAYRRGDALDKRRRLMRAWASFCTSQPSEAAVVVRLRERAG